MTTTEIEDSIKKLADKVSGQEAFLNMLAAKATASECRIQALEECLTASFSFDEPRSKQWKKAVASKTHSLLHDKHTYLIGKNPNVAASILEILKELEKEIRA